MRKTSGWKNKGKIHVKRKYRAISVDRIDDHEDYQENFYHGVKIFLLFTSFLCPILTRPVMKQNKIEKLNTQE